jgi:hypothetical protein
MNILAMNPMLVILYCFAGSLALIISVIIAIVCWKLLKIIKIVP